MKQKKIWIQKTTKKKCKIEDSRTKKKGEKGKDKRTVFASFTSIAGSRKNAYTPYSDMVLRHDKICCTTDKSPFKK